MSEPCVVLTTFDDDEVGRKIVETLLAERLAACIQVLPIESWYRWEGEVRHEAERLAVVKTQRSLVRDVESTILAHHSYDTPEIVVLPIVDGSPDYLSWLASECRPPRGSGER